MPFTSRSIPKPFSLRFPLSCPRRLVFGWWGRCDRPFLVLSSRLVASWRSAVMLAVALLVSRRLEVVPAD